VVEHRAGRRARPQPLRMTRFGVEVAGFDEFEPCAAANASAPAPANSTCSLASITRRAASTGLRTRVAQQIAPAASVAPSITAASSSCLPSAV
jgi:hypothetical protein